MTDKSVFIGTSWKMNKTRAEAEAFADVLAGSSIAQSRAPQLFVIPSFPYIATVAEKLNSTRVMVGAQNMHWASAGAWTGEVSPLMIKDCGATVVELGHSERRTHFGETDETVALKVASALAHGLIPLICIGDTIDDYKAGRTSEVLEKQVRAALSKIENFAMPPLLFAYEPVWSIGEAGVPADPEFVNREHQKLKIFIAAHAGFSPPVLYGGSVNQNNCIAFVTQPHIDGLFIGRAAWDPHAFIAICNSVTTALELV